MSDTQYKMIGILSIILSVFFLLGALYLGVDVVPMLVIRSCWFAGLILLGGGIVFYKVMRKDK